MVNLLHTGVDEGEHAGTTNAIPGGQNDINDMIY